MTSSARSHASKSAVATLLPVCFAAALALAASTQAEPRKVHASLRAVQPVTGSPPPYVRNGARSPGWLSVAAAREPVIYVADGDQVVVFPKNGRNRSPLGVITNGVTSAYGLCVDRERDLYVVNQGSNIVGLYPPGATSPSRTYSEGLKRPLYCVTDSRLTLYVGNADGGQIVEYRRGSKAPRRILNTHGSEADGLGVDAAGNLYAAYRRPPYSDGSVELFVRGSARGWILGMRLTQPQGLAIDGKGDVIVAETGGKNVVDLFVPGHTKPSRQIAAGHIPNGVALGERDAHLYVSDLDDEVYALRYPNGALRVKIDNSLEPQLVQGLAVSPVAP